MERCGFGWLVMHTDHGQNTDILTLFHMFGFSLLGPIIVGIWGYIIKGKERHQWNVW